MSAWNQNRLIDIFTNVDISLLESEMLEADLENAELMENKKEKWGKKKIAVISGIAAGSVAITGAVVLLLKKSNWLRRAA
ncbi:MAG: hypothetical protein U0L12_12145 [Ruminococcus sp.]|nr:hypothetical protein [Ruminococcus sp.]